MYASSHGGDNDITKSSEVQRSQNRNVFPRGARNAKRHDTAESPHLRSSRLPKKEQSDQDIIQYSGLDSLQNKLEEYQIEWATEKRIPEKVKDLNNKLRQSFHVLAATDGTIGIKSGHVHMQIVYDSRTLVVTHERLQHNCAKVMTNLPNFVRNMHLTFQEGVEQWFSKSFGMDLVYFGNGVKVTGVSEISSIKKESEQFPGLLEVHKLILVTVVINSKATAVQELLAIPSCHPITIPRTKSSQEPCLLCSWWPDHLLPNIFKSNTPSIIKSLVMDKRSPFVFDVLRNTLSVEPERVYAVVWNPPTETSMLLAVSPPADRAWAEPLLLVHMFFQGAMEKHSTHEDGYKKMKQVLLTGCARIIRVHIYEDHGGRATLAATSLPFGTSAKQVGKTREGALIELALDHACWDSPELAAGSRVSVCVVEDVARLFVLSQSDCSKGPQEDAAGAKAVGQGTSEQDSSSIARSGSTSQIGSERSSITRANKRRSNEKDGKVGGVEEGSASSWNSPETGSFILATALTGKMPKIIKQIAGPRGILSQLMSHPERKQHNILDIYQLTLTIMQHATKNKPGWHGNEIHNPFNPTLKKVFKRSKTNEQPQEDVVSRALKVMQALQAKLQEMQESHKWRKDCWRPVACMAHGNLTCENLLADGFGSAWLYTFEDAGVRPVWADVAKLSLSLLLDCCNQAICFDHLALAHHDMCATKEDLTQWLGVHPKVADVLNSECIADAELQLAAQACNPAGGMGEDIAQPTEGSSRRSSKESPHNKAGRQSDCIEETGDGQQGRSSIGNIRESADSQMQAARKVLRLLERAAAADPLRPSAYAFRILESQIVSDTKVVHQCLEEFDNLAVAWVAQLDVTRCRTDLEPPKLTGYRQRLWDLQRQLFADAIASYNDMLKQMVAMTPGMKLMPIDTSPILIELPLLEGALKYLSSDSVAPWQKTFICSLVAALGDRILQDLKMMEAPSAAEVSLPPPVEQASAGIAFAPGHRLLLGTDNPTDEPKKLTGEVLPVTAVSECGPASFGECVYYQDGSLQDQKALLCWPCSGRGMNIEEFSRMRVESEVDGSDVNICHQFDVAMQTRLSSAGLTALQLRKRPWPEMFTGSACSGCYEVVGVEHDSTAGMQIGDVFVEDVGVGLLLGNVKRDELLLDGRRVGWAAHGRCIVNDCPRKCDHAKATKQMPLTVYNRFPCTGCGRIMNLGEASGCSNTPAGSGSKEVDAMSVHCTECWRSQKRFDLCQDCVRKQTPLCSKRHHMDRHDESPYDGEPRCRRCEKIIPPMPPWDEPESHNKQAMEVPRWFHCRHCHQEQNPPFDLCTDCAYVNCPLGHKMTVLSRTRSTLLGNCHHCGKGGGIFNILHCIKCQDLRHEVVYPSVDAARLDIQLASSNNKITKNTGLTVTSVKRGGAAALAGVHSGYRLVSVNKRQVKGPVEFAYVGVRGALLAEFAGPLFSVMYDDAKEILPDVKFQCNDGLLIVIKATFGGKAAQAGVGRGCRLLSINDKSIEKLKWDGASPLSTVTSMAPPFLLSFQPRGSEFVYHEGCGIACDFGHYMEPQFPPFVCCEEGHPMLRRAKSELKLTTDERCDLCDEVLVDDPDLFVMYCGICKRDILPASPSKRRVSDGPMQEKSKVANLPHLASSFSSNPESARPSVIRGAMIHSARHSARPSYRSDTDHSPPESKFSSGNGNPSLRGASNLVVPMNAGGGRASALNSFFNTPSQSRCVSIAPSMAPSMAPSPVGSRCASPRGSFMVDPPGVLKHGMSLTGVKSSFADVAQQLMDVEQSPRFRPSISQSHNASPAGSRESSPDSAFGAADMAAAIYRSLTPVLRGPAAIGGRARRNSLPGTLMGLSTGRRKSFGCAPTQALAATQQNRLVCRECAANKVSMQKNRVPYCREGTVKCSDCGRTDLGRPKKSKEQNPNIPFFHCSQCSETRFDVCLDCIGHHLMCDSEHLMVQCTKSPYLCELQCTGCTKPLPLDDRCYHCDTCWWQDGVQLDRCSTCAERQKVEVALDETARFQLLSKEAPHGNLIWDKSVAPMARVFAAGAHLLIRLQLRGFVYPPSTRVRIQTDGKDREATLCAPPLSNGKYEFRFDGGDETIMLDPDLTNHIPAGVFRYSPGQKLSVFVGEPGWLDVYVQSLDAEGNGHQVEALQLDFYGAFRSWYMILNTWNHTPLWLDINFWIPQQRSWNEQITVDCSGSADVITGRSIDVMSFLWNLQSAEGVKNMWAFLITFTSRSSERHQGMHHSGGIVLLGPPSSGKTTVLKRLAIECIKDPHQEIVPLLINTIHLVQTFGGSETCIFRLRQLSFLQCYLAALHGAGTNTYWFLLQALHARRLLILLDGMDEIEKECDLQMAIFTYFDKLRASGHRIVVAISVEPCVGEKGGSSKLYPAVALPKSFQPLWIMGFSAEQRHWLAEQRLGENVAPAFLSHLDRLEADISQLLSTPLMFEVFLRSVELRVEEHKREKAKQLEEKQAGLDDDDDEFENPAEQTIHLPDLVKGQLDKIDDGSPESGAGNIVEEEDDEKEVLEVVNQIMSSTVSEVLGQIVEKTLSSMAPVKNPDKAAYIVKLFQGLALKLQLNSEYIFHEKDIVEVGRGQPSVHEVWRLVEEKIQRGHVAMVSPADVMNKRGRLQSGYRFAHPCIQHFLASCAIVSQWGKMDLPLKSVEQALTDPETWGCVIRWLAPMMKGPLTLKMLETEPEHACMLADFMARSKSVTSLSYLCTNLGQCFSALQHVCNACRQSLCLSQLDISLCGLGSTGAQQLCAALWQHPKLETLNLKDNLLGLIGAQAVSEMICINRSIKTLDLSMNSIGDMGAHAISDALVENQVITSLNLQMNNISQEACKSLKSAVLLTEIHRVVDTRYNRINVPEFLYSGTAAPEENKPQPVIKGLGIALPPGLAAPIRSKSNSRLNSPMASPRQSEANVSFRSPRSSMQPTPTASPRSSAMLEASNMLAGRAASPRPSGAHNATASPRASAINATASPRASAMLAASNMLAGRAASPRPSEAHNSSRAASPRPSEVPASNAASPRPSQAPAVSASPHPSQAHNSRRPASPQSSEVPAASEKPVLSSRKTFSHF